MKRPSLVVVLLTVFGIGFFSNLGFWQLRRAAEKVAMFADFAGGTNGASQSWLQAIETLKTKRYARVQLRGEFSHDQTILLDSQRANGRIGVAVFNAFKPASSDQLNVLVARGFLPISPDRSAFPQPDVPSGMQTLSGILAPPPSSGIKLQADQLTDIGSARLLATRIEPTEIALRFNKPLLDYVLLLDSASPHGFHRDWKPASFGPDKHRGYALTWFGLALTVLLVFLLLHRRAPLKKNTL